MDRGLEIRSCCLYLKAFNCLAEKQPSSEMELTPFHTALFNADLEMITRILEKVADSDVIETVLNSPLINLQRQQVRTKNIPPSLIYIARIAHLLSPEDVKKVAFEMETRHHIPSHVNIMSRITEALYLELPLSLACASGNRTAVETLIKYGACLHARDSKQENVIHSLVRLSEKAPKTAVSMYTFIMEEICDMNMRASLLHAINIDGRQPLDLAGKLRLPEMLLAIINTDGVYRSQLMEYGLVRLVRYDLTDYESDDVPTHKSLLYQLTNMDEAQLSRAMKCQLLSSEPFDSWIKTKCTSRNGLMRAFIFLWATLVSFFVLTLVTYIDGKTNTSYLIISTLLAVAYLTVEFFHSKHNIREIRVAVKGTLIFGHVPVTFTFAYRFFQIAFCIFIVFSAVCYPLRCSNPSFILATFVISTILGCLSFLFFMQFQSNVGHLLIVLQKVVYDTVLFMCLIFIFYLAFVLSLFLLHRDMYLETCSSVNSSNIQIAVCDTGDSFPKDFWEALYETVLLMLAVMAPRDTLFKCSHIPGLASFLYILLLIIVSIILVNLLIAVMAQRIDEISRMKEAILKLERISIVLYVEERFKTKIVVATLKLCQNMANQITMPWRRWKSRPKFRKKPRPTFVKTNSGRVYLDLVETLLEDKVSRKYAWPPRADCHLSV